MSNHRLGPHGASAACNKPLVALIAAGSLFLAPRAGAEVQFFVQVRDPDGLLLPDGEAIRACAQAAGDEWATHLKGSAHINVLVEPETGAPAWPGAIAWCQSTKWNFVAERAGVRVWESGAAQKLNGQADPDCAETDIEITLNMDYFWLDVWLDPAPGKRDAPVPKEQYDAVSIFAHEIGHALVFYGMLASDGLPPTQDRSPFDERVFFDGQVYCFSGDRAEACYGGPIPLSSRHLYHLGNNFPRSANIDDSVMTSRGRRGCRQFVSELDLAILRDCGVPTASRGPWDHDALADEPQVRGQETELNADNEAVLAPRGRQ